MILYFWVVVTLICAVVVACAVGAVAYLIGFSFWWGPDLVLAAIAVLFARGWYIDWRAARKARG